MFNYVTRKELKRQNRALRDEIIEMYFRIWELEDIALDAQFLLEENRISFWPEMAEDVIDRVDAMRLKLKAISPDEDDD
jgi:hypothetical protein